MNFKDINKENTNSIGLLFLKELRLLSLHIEYRHDY